MSTTEGGTSSAAILAQGISKRFRLSQSRSSLKDRIFARSSGEHQDFWALKPMDLRVALGETVGILGHNGSGKSTLLKCMAGILKPTTGTVRVRGRVASLLELGAGFHPDLTGRENVFINAAFLGIPRREIEQRFDAIVEFAELQQFIDTQVKYYSSGMFVRLGFAVAVNVDPDVLLVDEVLAVGDEVFQQKCLDRVEDFQREGRTIVFVTHAADLVRRICGRAFVLHHGELVADTNPAEAIRVFREHLHGTLQQSDSIRSSAYSTATVVLGQLTFTSGGEPIATHARSGDPVTIQIPFHCQQPAEEAVLSIQLLSPKGESLFAVTSDALNTPLPTLSGEGTIAVEFERVPLLDGRYPICVRLHRHHDGATLALRENLDALVVMSPGREEGIVWLSTTIRVSRDQPEIDPPSLR